MMERSEKLAQEEHANNILKAEEMMALTEQMTWSMLDQDDVMQ